MFEINNTIVSRDIFTQFFYCDIEKCHGACCVHGESGAPLEPDEVLLLKKMISEIAPFMRPEAVQLVRRQGVSVMDNDGDLVTPLFEGKECVYTVFEGGVARCAIEKAFFHQVISFRKPISCHLYPIRVETLKNMKALNYHRWTICSPAIARGKEKKSVLVEFLKEPLIRKFGESWYTELMDAFRQFMNENDSSLHSGNNGL